MYAVSNIGSPSYTVYIVYVVCLVYTECELNPAPWRVGGFKGGRGGFINIKDMYNSDVGKGGARVYEAYEVPFYFINLWLIPDRHRYCTSLYYLCVSVCVYNAYKQKRGHICPWSSCVYLCVCVSVFVHMHISKRIDTYVHGPGVCICVCVCVCVCVCLCTHWGGCFKS